MADTGPTRSDRDGLKNHRAEKPYDRVQPRPPLRRSASIVESLKSIVTKPFSWLTSGPAGRNSQPENPPDCNPTPSLHIANSKVKRKPSSPDSSEPEPSPKKRRRGSPNAVPTVGQSATAALRSSISVPLLNSQSGTPRPGRATFLPPLPRTSTPTRQSSIEPARFASPALRASPSVGSTVFAGRAMSITPQTSLDERTDRTAFGLRYRSPFVPRASPAPPMNPSVARAPSLSRQSSRLSERGGSGTLPHPKPRPALTADDHETERVDSVSPTRPGFSPAVSPLRRLSDGVNNQLVPSFQSTNLRHTGSLDPHSQQYQVNIGPDTDSTLAPVQRAVSYVTVRSASPERMSIDRVFQALEEALPWSQSRKLRHEQRARIKVPVPATASKLGGRAGRMVKPYARSHQHMTTGGTEPVHAEPSERPNNLFNSLVEKRNAANGTPSQDADDTVVKDENMAPIITPLTQGPTSYGEPQQPESSSITTSTFLPPLPSISEDREPAKPLPFALVPVAIAAPPDVVESKLPGSQSSLRERRTRTSAVHALAVPRRPTGIDKRPNRFALDEWEDSGDGKALDPEEVELKQWASKSGIALEVPTGWSFRSAPVSAATNNVTAQEIVDRPEATADAPLRNATSRPASSLILSPTPTANPPVGPPSVTNLFASSSPPSLVTSLGAREGDPSIKKEITTSIAPPVTAKSAGVPSLFAGFGGVPGNDPSATATASLGFPNASASTAPTPASGNGPNPFGNSATSSTPFGTPGIFGNVGMSRSQSALNAGTRGTDHKTGEAGEEAPAKTMGFFGGAPAPEGAEIGKPSPSKPSHCENSSLPLDLNRRGTLLENDSRTVGAVGVVDEPSEEAPAKPSGAMAIPDEHLPTSKFPSANGATGSEGNPVPNLGPPSASTFEPNPNPNPPAPKASALQSLTERQDTAPAKPFTWPNTLTDVAPQPASPSVPNAVNPDPTTSIASSGSSEPAVPPIVTPQTTALAFGTLINGTSDAAPSPITTSVSEQQHAISPSPFAAVVPVLAEPFKFGLNTQKSAVEYSIVKSDDPKPKQPNPPGTSGVFSFGNPLTSTTTDRTKAVPLSAFASLSEANPTPLFSFATPQKSPSTNHPSGIDGSQDDRPATPPPTNTDNMMETSPVQSVTAPSITTNDNNPFTFGTHTPSSATPAFAFGSTQPNPSTPAFGEASSRPTHFAFSPSRPETPSKSFGNPSALFGPPVGTPSSPFGATQQLPAPAFTFGSPGSQPQPSTPAAPAFSFNFSPVASPTLSPTTLGGGGINAPFVFGASGEASSQPPATPTTPNRRPLRGLPQRKKR